MRNLIAWLFILATCLATASSTEARYYDPQTGRFLQEDPEQPGQVRVQGGRVVVVKPSAPSMMSQRLNPYVYVSNNPINLVDPYGLLERGTKEWSHVRGEAEKRLRGEAEKAKVAGFQCPVIPGTPEDESVAAVGEAIADEVTPKEYGILGTGLLSKRNLENIDQRMRQKHPDWPWAGWDDLKKQLEEHK